MKLGVLILTLLVWLGGSRPAQAAEKTHYELRRDVYKVTLTGSPLARVVCVVADSSTGTVQTLIWSPEDRQSHVRYALVPPSSGRSPARSLSCRSEAQIVKDSAGDRAFFYVADEVPLDGSTTFTLGLRALSGNAATQVQGADLTVSVSKVTGRERQFVLRQRAGEIQTTRLRSLDPTTALLNDALTALATIALERAETAGKQYARWLMKKHLCDALTVKQVRLGLQRSAFRQALEKLKWPDDRRILHNTCALVETLRVDELVSAKDAVWKAVGADASELASAFLRATLNELDEDDLGSIVQATSGLITSALTGSTTTERDAQVLLLSLGQIGFRGDEKDLGKTNWRFLLELGMAVLQECLRAGECSADELGRLLQQEVEIVVLEEAKRRPLLEDWPELPTVLGRAANVLRPAPGTPARTTAASAVALVLDVVEQALKFSQGRELVCLNGDAVLYLTRNAEQPPEEVTDSNRKCDQNEGWKLYEVDAVAQVSLKADGDADELSSVQRLVRRPRENALALVRTLRGVVAALEGGDVTSAVVEFERVFESAIVDACAERKGVCKVPVTSVQLRKGFRVLAAVATYGASYRKADGATDSAELERQRADERRKAMESLIDSLNDRSDRHRNWVLSLGSNVGFGPDYRLPNRGADNYYNRVPLSLRTGLALQSLPGETFWPPGFHVMVSALDLAQYASVGTNDQDETTVQDPSFSTALRLGGEVGILFGQPSFPVTVTAQGGWIPHVDYGDGSEPRSEWSIGVGVGVFVPFIDLN